MTRTQTNPSKLACQLEYRPREIYEEAVDEVGNT